ncbi:MAG: hypothetical protein QX198_11610 [Methylococcaceae bacterium]
MFKKSPLKLELDGFIDEAIPKELVPTVVKAFLPVQAAHAWLVDSGIKYSAADVISLAGLLQQRFPY